MNGDSQSSGIFRVINDLAGTLGKVAESYYDVRAARGETLISPAPAVAGESASSTRAPDAAVLDRVSLPGWVLPVGLVAAGLVLVLILRK